MSVAPRRRLFFALWPSEAERDQLLDAVRAARMVVPDRAVSRSNLHLTLTFLGSVTPAQIEAAVSAAQRTVLRIDRPIAVTLDALQFWPKTKVLTAVPAGDPSDARWLARSLATQLRTEGFALPVRRFRPHVTLARDVRGKIASQSMPPVRWTFDRVCLMESQHPAPYRLVNSWPLTNASRIQ